MKNKFWYVPAALAVVAVAAAAFLLSHHRRAEKEAMISPPPAAATAEIQKRAEVLYRQKRYAPLIETYRRMLEKTPGNVEVKKKLAFAYFGAAQYADAKPLLNEVAGATSADAEVFYELGFIASTQGDKAAARGYFQRALEIDPRHKGAGEMLEGEPASR